LADMTATTMATWLNEIWSPLATITYRQKSILPPLMDRRWEPEAGAGKGDTINIPNFTQNSRTNVTKRSTFGTGAAVTFVANTESQTQLSINQMAYYAFRLPVEMSVQAQAQYMKLAQGAAPEAIAQQVDYELASDGTNGFDAFTAIGTDNVDVTEPVVLSGEQVLNENHAPLAGRYFVFSPATYASLIQIEAFRNQLYKDSIGNLSGDKGPGYVGHILTLDCYMHADLEAGTSGKKNFIGQTEAIAFAEQQSVKVIQATNIADGGFFEYMAYNVYGFKQVKSSFGREVDGK
jgi:hypothetical protein